MTPGQAQTLLQQAQAQQSSGRLAEAIATCKTILKSRPRDFEVNYFAAILHTQQGDVEGAVKFFTAAVKASPDVTEARYNLAYALSLAARHEDAAGQYEKILKADPGHLNARVNYANTLTLLGRHAEALTHYDRMLEAAPASAGLHASRAAILKQLNRLEDALAACDRAIELDRGHAEAHFNRGTVLHEAKRFDDALAGYDQALAINPRYAEAWFNRGVTLYDLRLFDEAVSSYDRAIEITPDYAEAWFNRGNALHEVKRFDEAIACFDKALLLKPGDRPALFARASTKLLRGDFGAGWVDYEHRPLTAPRTFKRPPWRGNSDIAGETILIHCEQGLGDTIQFCRYVKLLEEKGAKVLFAPQAALKALLGSMGRSSRLVDVNDRTLYFEHHCPLVSLPLAFKTDQNSIPAQVPYLSADPARAKQWAEKLGTDGFKVGICWQGAPTLIDAGRSFPVLQFLPLSRIPGVRLISLHKGEGESQLATLPPDMKVETLGDFDQGPDAFVDTAAVMSGLDLIVTSDTAIAHLAGALGRPTWVVLQQVPDWRWLLDRTDSPWYPTLRLFRQPRAGDWKSVFAQVEAALRDEIKSGQKATG